jgi:glycosyltransferase involved in cell wall biosynthesis
VQGQVLELVRGLDRERLQVELVLFEAVGASAGTTGAEEEFLLGLAAGQYTGNMALRVPQLSAAVLRLASHFRRTRPDVVHAFLPAAAMIGCAAARLAGVPVRIVGRRSLIDLYRGRTGLMAFADRFPLRFATAVVGNCAAIAREAVTIDGFPEACTFTIRNGVDLDRFAPGYDMDLRRAAGFSQQHVVFGTIANFRDCKRHMDIVHAAVRLKSSFPGMRFVMVGEDQGALSAVRQEAEQAGVAELIKVVPADSAPERWYRVIDVYLCTSSTEGLSNSVLEAMACGRPVVATDVGGNPELVRPENGLLVPCQQPAELAHAMEALLRDRPLRSRLGRAGRRFAEVEFSIARMVAQHEQLYNSLLSRALPACATLALA